MMVDITPWLVGVLVGLALTWIAQKLESKHFDGEYELEDLLRELQDV